MNAKQIASYGSWKSPISTDLITAKTISLMELMLYLMRQENCRIMIYIGSNRIPWKMDATPSCAARLTRKPCVSHPIFMRAIRFMNMAAWRLLSPQEISIFAITTINASICKNRVLCLRPSHSMKVFASPIL